MLSGTAHLFANHVCAGQIGRDEGSLRGDHAGMKEGKELSDLLVAAPSASLVRDAQIGKACAQLCAALAR